MRRVGLAAALLGLALVSGACGAADTDEVADPAGSGEDDDPGSMREDLSAFDLATDTSRSLIDIDELVSGGPGKDDIPALSDPEFVALDESTIPDDVDGVLVERSGEKRFYPHNIMVWHEIADDEIDGEPYAVTF